MRLNLLTSANSTFFSKSAFWYSFIVLATFYVAGLNLFLYFSSQNDPQVTGWSLPDWLVVISASSAMGLVVAAAVVVLEYGVFTYWQDLSFWVFVALKYLVIFVVIDLIIIGMSLGYYFLISRFSIIDSVELLSAFLNSRNYNALSVFLSVLSIQLNVFKTLSDYLGHKAAIGVLMGKFHRPLQEDLTFIFIDLQSSTQIAEKLGHVQYSQLIKRCFELLTQSIDQFDASVYQFVGDEAVLFWRTPKAQRRLLPIRLYFDFIENINHNAEAFMHEFGMIPHFRAAIHSGMVTVTEIKSVKREIVYHGDVLNTCARIKDICSKADIDLLASPVVAGWIPSKSYFKTNLIGSQLLRGKVNEMEVFEIKTQTESQTS